MAHPHPDAPEWAKEIYYQGEAPELSDDAKRMQDEINALILKASRESVAF